jgi:hypothetical protein
VFYDKYHYAAFKSIITFIYMYNVSAAHISIQHSYIKIIMYCISLKTIVCHHHMALQPNSGPGLPLWGFTTITFLQGWIVSPAPNPQPGGPGLRLYDSWRQGGPAIPPGTGTQFSYLLRHAWVTVGLFFNSCHHMGPVVYTTFKFTIILHYLIS